MEFNNYSPRQSKDLYDKFYESEDFPRFPKADRHFIQAVSGRFYEGCHRILDVGCGTGKYSKYLSDQGHKVVGVDISDNAISTASDRYPNIDFRRENIINTTYTNEFDGILCHGFPPFNEPDLNVIRPIMARLVRMLRPGGVFFFGKTTSLTGTEEESRTNHTLSTLVSFIDSIQELKVIHSAATVPHVFIFFGEYGFVSWVTAVSRIASYLTGIPLRAYVVAHRIRGEG